MTDMPQHAAPAVTRSRHAAAWVTMAGAGSTGVAYNLYCALHGGPANPVLAVLLGVMPMTLAMLLTHVVGDAAEQWMRRAVLAVMLAAMALSLSATASVVASGPGIHYRAYGFGLVLDAASLLAFRVIVSGRQREDAAAEAVRAAKDAAREARARLAASEASAGDAAAAAAARAVAMKEELAAAAAELEAERARSSALAERLASARKPARGSARKPARNSGGTSARKQTAGSAPEAAPEADLDTEAQALLILGQEPGISGSQLGLRLGKSDRYGRDLIKRLAPSVPGPDTPQ